MKYIKLFENYKKPELHIFDTRAFSDYVYGNSGILKDPTIVDRIKYFLPELDLPRFKETLYILFFPLTLGEKVIGLGKLHEDPYNKENYWIQYISIDPKYQSKGYATEIATAMFKWAVENNKSLESSSYNEIGTERIKKVFNRLATEYNVKFKDEYNVKFKDR